MRRQAHELQYSIHHVFVDFEKAFDRLKHNNIWKTLHRKGLPEKLINLTKCRYVNAKQCTMVTWLTQYPVQLVFRQDWILSPLIFLIVLDEILSNVLDDSKRGIMNILLEDLDYANYIALKSKRGNDIQSKLNKIYAKAKKCGPEDQSRQN